jgi:motility quorum-sensing regulator / GCU-specific mRNA interferase toxin
MEKQTPHCKLTRVFELIDAELVRATLTAQAGAAALELDFDAMLSVVRALTTADFYKSMTTHADHRVWQDVYRPRATTPVGETDLYIKLTVIDDVLIVSFKEQ